MNKRLYKQGVRKEYKIVSELKKDYDIVQRTAGSHSPIDIIAIDVKSKCILLVQSKRVLNRKMSYINPEEKQKIEAEQKELNGIYRVMFEVR